MVFFVVVDFHIFGMCVSVYRTMNRYAFVYECFEQHSVVVYHHTQLSVYVRVCVGW